MTGKYAILKRADDEVALAAVEIGEKRIGIALAIHHVNRARLAAEQGFSVIDAVVPPSPFASALGWRPILLSDRFVESKNRFQREKAEWLPRAIRSQGEREMAKKTLGRWLDQAAESLTLRGSGELELGGVVYHQDPLMLSSPKGRLTKVRRENRFGRHSVVAEESVCRLELSVIERVREALAGTLRQLIR